MSSKVTETLLQYSEIKNNNVYQLSENIPAKHNIYLLQTELDFFREGKMQRNCIYSYYDHLRYPPLEKDNCVMEGIEEVSLFFSYREEMLPVATLEVVFIWNYKKQKFKDFHWFKQILGKMNSELNETTTEKIKNNFEKYYQEVLIDKLIPVL